jgi:hypothetical protein
MWWKSNISSNEKDNNPQTVKGAQVGYQGDTKTVDRMVMEPQERIGE